MSAEPAPGGAPAADRIGVGIVSIMAAVFFFAISDALAKWLGQTYEPVQIVFLRYVFGMIPAALLVWHGGGLGVLRTRRPVRSAERFSRKAQTEPGCRLLRERTNPLDHIH